MPSRWGGDGALENSQSTSATFANLLSLTGRAARAADPLSDRAFVALMDAENEADFQKRRELLHYEATQRHAVTEAGFQAWQQDCTSRFQRDNAAFRAGAAQGEEPGDRELIEALLLERRWPELVPFSRSEQETMPFPVEALPGVLGEIVPSLSEALQVSPGLVGACLLGALSLAAGRGRFLLECRPGWEEQVCLYVACVARPGERKSAVLSALQAPLLEYQKQRNEEDAADISASQAQYAMLLNEYNRLLKQFKGGEVSEGKNKKTVTAEDVEAAKIALDSFKVKQPLRLFAGDVTEEKLGMLMQQQGEVVGVVDAEGGIFETMSGKRYGNGGTSFDLYLKAHDGDYVQVDRVQREPVALLHPRLTVLLMFQPSVLEKLLENGDFSGKGLTTRFLFSRPPSMLGSRNVTDPPPVPDHLRQRYCRLMELIVGIESDRPLMLSLSPGALERLCSFAASYEPEMREGGSYAHMTGTMSKMAGQVARIAALLHVALHAEEDLDTITETPVSGETMGRAIQIGYYFVAQAEQIFDRSQIDQTQRDARGLWARLEKLGYGGQRVNQTELTQKIKSQIPTKERRTAALEELERRGYVLLEQEEPAGRGRPSTFVRVRESGAEKSDKSGK